MFFHVTYLTRAAARWSQTHGIWKISKEAELIKPGPGPGADGA